MTQPKRKTSIALSSLTERQIEELSQATGHNQTTVIEVAVDRMHQDETRHNPPYNNFIDEFFTLRLQQDGAIDRVNNGGRLWHLHRATEQDILHSFIHAAPLWKRVVTGDAKPDDAISVPRDADPLAVFDDGPTVIRYRMVHIYYTEWPEEKYPAWPAGV